MQKPSISKKKTSVSEKLNQQIRHLLFLNPLLDFFAIKRQINLLPSQLKNDKLETIRYLTQQREEFIKKSALTHIAAKSHVTS